MYSLKLNDESMFAKARVEEVDASFKDLAEVCSNIRGKPLSWVLQFLEDAAKGKRAVLYRRHNKKLGHRRELGGKKGRYPRKAAKVVLQVVMNALANARNKNLAEDTLIIVHAAANKKRNYPRLQPKGRRTRHDYETARVEIILKASKVVEKKEKKVEKKVEKKEEKSEKKGEKKIEEPKKEEKKVEEKKPKAEPRQEKAEGKTEEKAEKKSEKAGKAKSDAKK